MNRQLGNFYETKECPYPYYRQRGYKIQLDLRLKHNPLQRHIWFREDGAIDIEEWIPTFILDRFLDEVAAGHYTEVDKLNPPAEMESQIINTPARPLNEAHSAGFLQSSTQTKLF